MLRRPSTFTESICAYCIGKMDMARGQRLGERAAGKSCTTL